MISSKQRANPDLYNELKDHVLDPEVRTQIEKGDFWFILFFRAG